MPKEPHLGPAPHTAHYAPTDGTLYDGGPRPQDVEQHRMGDCFFLAVLASLAQRHPEAIEKAIVRHANGTYAVRFYRKGKDGCFTPHEVDIDGKLPEAEGHAIYARFPVDGALWVPLLEKAYAVHLGGYGDLNRGGLATTAMESLTGVAAHLTWVEDAKPDEVWTVLHDAVHAGKLTTAGTYAEKDIHAVLARQIKRGVVDPKQYDAKTFNYKERGLVADHEYTVWGIHGTGAARAIVLRNPWGHFEPQAGGDGKDDGIFTLPFAEFMILLETASVGSTKG
jgi:hypothetical protein